MGGAAGLALPCPSPLPGEGCERSSRLRGLSFLLALFCRGRIAKRTPDRDALQFGFLRDILGNAVTGKHHNGTGFQGQHVVIALERCRAVMRLEVRAKRHLWNASGLGPKGGDVVASLFRSAVQEDHIPYPVTGLIECGIYRGVVVIVLPSGNDDARPSGASASVLRSFTARM